MTKNAPLVLIVLGLLVAAGAYNYHRNAALEQTGEFRPYEGISDADLEVLLAAYESEIEALRERLPAKGTSAESFEPTSGLIGDRVRDFEKSQRAGTRQIEARRELMEQEVTLQKLHREVQLRRSGTDDPWKTFLRRLTSL